MGFMQKMVDAQIIKNDVVEKWQLDDFDEFSDKKQALLVLSDVILDLQNRENQLMDLQTDTESEYSSYEAYGHYIDNQYIDTRDLLQPNTNRSVSVSRCPWKYETVC